MTQHVIDHASQVGSRRATRSAYLALAYTLLIAYATLNPFSGWHRPDGGWFEFLGVWPRYLTGFDLAINVAAYVPFGLLVGLALTRRLRHPELLIAVTLAGAALSLAMETLQGFVPGRIASLADLLTNTAGCAAGALAAPWLRSPRFQAFAARVRDDLFLEGRVVDWGIALLALWLFAQVNPSLPLMASWRPIPQPEFLPRPFSFLELGSALVNTLAMGTLLAALMQPARRAGIYFLGFLLALAATKWFSAQFLLKPGLELDWLTGEAVLGTGYGLVMAAVIAGAARLRVQLATTAAAVGASIVLASIARPEVASPAAALTLFGWRRGHLLSFTGLTQWLVVLWPYLALLYLALFSRKLGTASRPA